MAARLALEEREGGGDESVVELVDAGDGNADRLPVKDGFEVEQMGGVVIDRTELELAGAQGGQRLEVGGRGRIG